MSIVSTVSRACATYWSMESGQSLAAKQDWEMAHAARAATATANLIEGLPVSIIRGARKAKNGSAHCVRSKTRNTHNRTGTRRPKFRRTNHAPHFRKRASVASAGWNRNPDESDPE